MDPRLRKHSLGFWEVAKKPTVEELEKYYADKYYQHNLGSYEAEYNQEEISYFNAKLEQRYVILQHHRSAGAGNYGSMLDVGCGEGYALSFFRKKGWSTKGLDFSAAGVEAKNSDCMDVLETGNVFELLEIQIRSGARYDVVWLQNVLEHVIDPLALLRSLKSLISAGGIAVITVPNDFSELQKTALDHGHIDYEFWVAPPDHLTYFDSNSLVNSVTETGWKSLELVGDIPVDWFLFHSGSNYIRDQTLGKSAHNARVQIENMIHKQPVEDVNKFWSAAARIGIGRSITIFCSPESL